MTRRGFCGVLVLVGALLADWWLPGDDEDDGL